MDLKIVEFVQSGSTKFLDGLCSLLTKFGEEIFFVCVFLILYWCISYKYAFKFGLYYVTSVLVNNVIKMIVRRPRPWMASDTVINKLPASGLSFPSGHSQGVSCITTFVCYDYAKTNSKQSAKLAMIISSIMLCLIVGYTRLYLGQHYLTDVLTGFILGLVVILGMKLIERKIPKKYLEAINLELIICSLAIVVVTLVTLLQFFDFGLKYSLLKKLYKYTSLFIGATTGYVLAKRIVPEISMPKYVLALKSGIGLAIIFGLYALVSYFALSLIIKFYIVIILGIIATFVYPLVFNKIYNHCLKG